jgi:predicted nucleotidyltransferase
VAGNQSSHRHGLPDGRERGGSGDDVENWKKHCQAGTPAVRVVANMIQPKLQPPRIQVVDDALLREIVSRIVERFQPRRIILFGSRAQGAARPDSDVDLLVEMETADSMLERRQKIRALFRGRRWGLDLFVYTPEEMAERRRSLASIVSQVEREGKILYERS